MEYWADRISMTGPVYPPHAMDGQHAMMDKIKRRVALIHNMLSTTSPKDHHVNKELNFKASAASNIKEELDINALKDSTKHEGSGQFNRQ